MRPFVLSMILLLCGCLSVQEPHNPMKKAKKKPAPVEEATTAPVETSAPARPAPAPLGLDSVTLMKEMFLVQRDLNQQILKMAEELSEIELMEINQWLRQYGVQIQKKVKKPSHDPRRVF